MALWAQWQNLPEEAQRQIHNAYGDSFPIEVRCALAQWIEEKPWDELDQDNPQHEQYAHNLVKTLIAEIDANWANETNLVMKLKLQQAAQSFRQNYLNNPFILVRIVKHCILNDMKVIQQSQNCINMTNQETKPNILNAQQEMNLQLENLRKRTTDSDEELRRMQQEQEQLVIQYQESQKRQLQIQQLSITPNNGQNVEILSKLQKEKESLDIALRQRLTTVVQNRVTLIERHHETFSMLSALQHTVLDDELIRWKRGQQLYGNGVPFENNIDQIQEWCEALAELIWQNRQQVRRIEMLVQTMSYGVTPGINEKIESLSKLITSLLSSLVTSTFIIEKQPPQVMKTNTRFTSTVRLLVGGKLNVHMTPPQVKVTIISESQANCLLKNDKITSNEISGEILNNNGQMEYHQATRQLTVNFRNMQLRKIKRAEKKGTESVMDEKFSLLFQSQFKVGGGELVFHVWTLSLPVVVIVHGNQEPHAWATVTWDNAFAEPGRVPFVVPEKVPWSQVGEVLSQKFKAAVGSGLKEEHLHFLACKALRNANLSFQDYNNTLISWSQFSKDPLPDRNFTFWEWFYAILKVTREHLRNLWNDSYIMGFVSRNDAEDMLAKRACGTFLLRFSDSELGGITIAWIAEGQERQECYMLQPFTSRNLAIRGLADCINDLKHLVYLYPDIPKDSAFGKYYTPYNENQSSNGYVRPELIAHIPGLTLGSSFGSYPNTPQSNLQNPHSPSESSIPYHDNPSIQSSMNDMNAVGVSDMDYVADVGVSDMDFAAMGISMDFMGGDMDVPVDFSNINVNDLMTPFNKTT